MAHRSIALRSLAALAAVGSLAFAPGTVAVPGEVPDAPACRLASRREAPALVHRHITFARVRGRALRLDLAAPASPGRRPLVVLVHGGAWRRGHRGDMRGTMEALAREGYAAATLDYRLVATRGNAFPGPVSDVRCAIRTLRSRASELGLDPDRVAAVGFSAGGHLASLAAMAPELPALDDGTCPVAPTVSAGVQAVAAFYGPHDLRAPLRVGPGAESAIAAFLGVSRRRDPARASLASPIVHVDRLDPPTLLVHGMRDAIVEIDQTQRMRRALERAGVPVRTLLLPARSHGFGMFPRHVSDDGSLACASLAFLSERLAPRAP